MRLVRKIESDQRTAAQTELTSVFLFVPRPEGRQAVFPSTEHLSYDGD